MKLLPIQQKIIDDIVKNPDKRYTIFYPRRFGYNSFLKTMERVNKKPSNLKTPHQEEE